MFLAKFHFRDDEKGIPEEAVEGCGSGSGWTEDARFDLGPRGFEAADEAAGALPSSGEDGWEDGGKLPSAELMDPP